jgi:hypothetical protein
LHLIVFDSLPWSQSYDHELQRQRCNNLKYNNNENDFLLLMKKTLAYAGVVVVNSAVVGLAPRLVA